jgi:phasin
MATTSKAAAAKTQDTVSETIDIAANVAPAQVRDLAEKSVKQAKDGYARLKSVAEETSDTLEDAYVTATRGYKELGRKSVDAARSNLNAHFDFLHALIGAKSVSQAVELQTSYARQQFEVVTSQVKELSSLAQKTATESSKPFQQLASKGVRHAQA